MSNYEEFRNCNEVVDKAYPHIKKYEYKDSLFFIEPNFYTQLKNIEVHFVDNYQKIIDTILDIALRNKRVIFTADFNNPVVYKEGYIYRELDDVLAELHLVFDYKGDPNSDWKD